MNLDQWTQWWWQIVQSVATITAIFVRRAIDLCLTIVQRVVRAQAIDSGPQGIVQRRVGGTHIGPTCLAVFDRHSVSSKHSALGLHRHIGTVGMPAHIAHQYLHDIIAAVCQADAAIAPDIADWCQVEFQFAEASSKINLGLVAEMLAWEHQQSVLKPG